MTLAILALVLAMQAAGPMPNDVATIVQRSVEASNRDWKAAPEYDYSQRVQEEGGAKVYDVIMILGSPYKRLTGINGKPLTAPQQLEEQHKLDQAIAARRNESPQERNVRVARYVKDRTRDHSLMQQLTQAFDFKLEGEQKLGMRDVYVLRATPRRGYHPPTTEAKVLTGMQGRLWIDKTTFQWVKVEAEVVHPVTIEGFLARVEPGTRFELDKMPVDGEIWLPQHFAMKSRSRIVFLFSHKNQEQDTFWGYRKAAADTITDLINGFVSGHDF
jgi:hypothetical protein